MSEDTGASRLGKHCDVWLKGCGKGPGLCEDLASEGTVRPGSRKGVGEHCALPRCYSSTPHGCHQPSLCIQLSSLSGASLSSSRVEAKSQGDGSRDVKGTENAARAQGTSIALLPARAMMRPGAAAPPLCSSAGRRQYRTGRREAANQPTAPLLPTGLALRHPASNPLCPGMPRQFWARPRRRAQPGLVQARASRSTEVSGSRQ